MLKWIKELYELFQFLVEMFETVEGEHPAPVKHWMFLTRVARGQGHLVQIRE